MSAIVLYGKPIAEQIRESLIQRIREKNMRPQLGIICPDLPSTHSYLKAQVRLAESLGIKTIVMHCNETTRQSDIELVIRAWNKDSDIHGIFILQPFIKEIDLEHLATLIDPLKDVECIHPYNSSLRYFSKTPMNSCTAMAIMAMLDSIGTIYRGSEAVVVGSSKIVGRPTAMLLADREATVTMCQKSTSDKDRLRDHVSKAEILVVAAGRAGLIPGEWIREGTIVIDVGFNETPTGVVGDVVFDTACERASYITKPIGGVGPITAMICMRQLVLAYEFQHSKKFN